MQVAEVAIDIVSALWNAASLIGRIEATTTMPRTKSPMTRATKPQTSGAPIR